MISSRRTRCWKQTKRPVFIGNDMATEFKVKVEEHYVNGIGNNGVSLQRGCSFVSVQLDHAHKRPIFFVQVFKRYNGRIFETQNILP